MTSTISIEPLKWLQIRKFLSLRQAIESGNEHLALTGEDRKSESILFAIGRLLANRRWTVVLIAKDGDKFIGYLTISFAKFRKMRANAYIVLSILSRYRGQGIGTRLMRAAEEAARRRGTKRLELEVFAKNTGAHKLFRRLGYEEEGRKRRAAETADGFDDLILMAKFID